MLTVTAQQSAFFSQNGFLELEETFSSSECDALLAAIQQTLHKRSGPDFVKGRDLWRDSTHLKTTLLSKKCSGLAFAMTRKPTLRLAFDQWFPPNFPLPTPEKLEKLFSIQGLFFTMFIRLENEEIRVPAKAPPLGISPFPKSQGSVLLIKPSLLLYWPPKTPGLYCISFCLPTSVYIQNPLDQAGLTLRKLDYGYGDLLRSDTHPLIHR